MFNFSLLSQNGDKAVIKVQCYENSNYNVEELEVYHNGNWYTPTKNGLNTLTNSIFNDKIRQVLIIELRKFF